MFGFYCTLIPNPLFEPLFLSCPRLGLDAEAFQIQGEPDVGDEHWTGFHPAQEDASHCVINDVT